MTTGDKIRKLRLEYNMTQEDLGERLGVGKSAIAKYENDRVKNLKKYTIIKLGEIFNVTPDYLLGNEIKVDNRNEIFHINNARIIRLALEKNGKTTEQFAKYVGINPRLAKELTYYAEELSNKTILKFTEYLKLDLSTYLKYTFLDKDQREEKKSDDEIKNMITEMEEIFKLRQPFEESSLEYSILFSQFSVADQIELLKEFMIVMEIKQHKNSNK